MYIRSQFKLYLNDFITGIMLRMEADKLKLNPNQTDLFIICTNLQRNNVIDNFPLNCWKGYIAHHIPLGSKALSLTKMLPFISTFLKYGNTFFCHIRYIR